MEDLHVGVRIAVFKEGSQRRDDVSDVLNGEYLNKGVSESKVRANL